MNAWWRCRAVGIRFSAALLTAGAGKTATAKGACSRCCGATCAQVQVRYAGYTPSDDEWRRTCSLRHAASGEALHRQWAVGERLECSAPPCKGHPPALWEASVHAVEASKKRQHVLVRFDGFQPEFDEWIPASSTRLRPPGLQSGLICTEVRQAVPTAKASTFDMEDERRAMPPSTASRLL